MYVTLKVRENPCVSMKRPRALSERSQLKHLKSTNTVILACSLIAGKSSVYRITAPKSSPLSILFSPPGASANTFVCVCFPQKIWSANARSRNPSVAAMPQGLSWGHWPGWSSQWMPLGSEATWHGSEVLALELDLTPNPNSSRFPWGTIG